ncbi:MAG: tetratricopeptide repeat protein [Kofleriaceae bacterium]
MRIGGLVVALCAIPRVASADLVKDAESLAAGGDFVSAAARFREAYAREPSRPELVCNAGVAYYKASDLPRAHRYLRRCLEVGKALDAEFMANVASVVSAVEGALASGPYTPVEVTTEPAIATVSIAGGAPFDEPLGQGRAWFPRGTYTLVVEAPGHDTQRRQLVAEGTASMTQLFQLTRTVIPRKPDRRWLGYTVGGIGVASFGVGVVFGVRARSLGNEVREECADTCDWNLVADKDAAGRRAQTIQFVMYGVSAVAIVAGTVLYLRGRPSQLDVVPREGGGMVTWSDTW